MKRLLSGVAVTMLAGNCAMAQDIGVAMAQFDNTFLTILRGGMEDRAGERAIYIPFELVTPENMAQYAGR